MSTPTTDPLFRKSRRDAPVLGDWVVLLFTDEKMLFCQVGEPVVFNKSKHVTKYLVGKQYETIFEVRKGGLWPLGATEKLMPDVVDFLPDVSEDADGTTTESTQPRDNRSLDDTNTAQGLDKDAVQQMKMSGTDGSTIIESLVENSTTFNNKTQFAKEKYIMRKQRKHMSRCRMVRCTAATVCRTLHTQSPKRILNLRPDTLAQMLSYTNLWAGCQTVIYEHTGGMLTGAVAQRLGGYGRILSLYSGQQHSYIELLNKYNLSFAETNSIQWVHTGDIYGGYVPETFDEEAEDRDKVIWPCLPGKHTLEHMERNKDTIDKAEYMGRQSSRFLRKLTRTTPLEAYSMLTNKDRLCDSIILATDHDVLATFMPLYKYLAPCSPFCVYSESAAPLLECSRKLQDEGLAINVRLSDTWAREFQVLHQRTHPSMTMSQSGGYLLTGTKLHSVMGISELDDAVKEEVKGQWRKQVRSAHKKARGGN